MNIRQKIAGGFILGLIFVAAIGFSAYMNTQRLLDANRWVIHTHEVIDTLEHMMSVLKDAETGQRGFVLTGEERYLEPYEVAIDHIKRDSDVLAVLTRDNPVQQEALRQVKSLVEVMLAELKETIELRRTSGLDAALKAILTDRSRKIMDELRSVVDVMNRRERNLLEVRNATATVLADRTLWTVIVWMPLALLVLALAALVLTRTLLFGGSIIPPAIGLKRWRDIAVRYAAAVIIVVVAAMLQRRLLESFGPLPTFIMFYPAVLLVATIGGGGPGIVSTLLAALAADYFFIPPYGRFMIEGANNVLALTIFICSNLFLSVLAERLRRARWAEALSVAQAEQLDALSQLNEELSVQSEELNQQTEELAQQNEELQAQSEEIHALNTELGHREEMLQKLLEAARLGTAEQTVLKEICAITQSMFGPNASAVIALELQGGALVVRAHAGLSSGDGPIAPMSAANCFEELVIAQNKTTALADAALYPDITLIQAPGKPRFQAVLAAPMCIAGRAFGTVSIFSHQKQVWTSEQFRLMEWLAAQCASTIETQRLQEQLKATEKENRLLADRMAADQARSAAIVESSDDAILSMDLSGFIQTWNAGAQRLFGYQAEEVIGKPHTFLIPEERLPEHEQIMASLVNGQHVARLETVRAGKGERMIDVSVNISPVRSKDGQIIGASKTLHDIGDRKQAYEGLQKTAADLARSNRDLEQFAYVASHDLKEPLRMVTGFMSLLKDRCHGKLDAKADEYIIFAADAAQRMQRLIDDLLVYSRAGRGATTEQTDINDVLTQATQNLTISIKESGAVITHDPLPTIAANKVELIHVFQNLIGNSIKFRGERSPEIVITAQRRRGHWQFTVSDNGIGIDQQFADRIFMIFQRLHTREQYPGTGIGLSICKKIVEQHGGRIWLEPSPKGGATFCFTVMDQEKDR